MSVHSTGGGLAAARQAVRARMDAFGWSDARLAEEAGVSYNSVHEWLQEPLSVDVLAGLAVVLGSVWVASGNVYYRPIQNISSDKRDNSC